MTTQFEDRLRDAMGRATGQVHLPPGLAVRAQQQRQRRKRTARIVTAAGTATVVGASLAIAGASGAFGSASGQPLRTSYTAYVVSHVERALAPSKTAGLVEYDRTVYQPDNTLQPFPQTLVGGAAAVSPWEVGYTLHWTYQRTTKFSAYTASGQHVFDLGLRPRHSSTAVIYRSDTWWTATTDSSAGPKPPASASCVRGSLIVLNGGGSGNGWPAFIRSQLACGAYTVVGHQVIGGIDTIKISGASGRFTFWVNPATYLPVQMTLPRQRTEFQWLAPTPANLAQLTVTVPAGFTQVPPPAAPGR